MARVARVMNCILTEKVDIMWPKRMNVIVPWVLSILDQCAYKRTKKAELYTM